MLYLYYMFFFVCTVGLRLRVYNLLITYDDDDVRPIRRHVTFKMNSNWTSDSNSNRISKLRRSLFNFIGKTIQKRFQKAFKKEKTCPNGSSITTVVPRRSVSSSPKYLSPNKKPHRRFNIRKKTHTVLALYLNRHFRPISRFIAC